MGGGPIQSPSDVLLVRFQAGLRIESIQTSASRATVSFRSLPGITNALEATDSMRSGTWQPVAGPLRGNNNLNPSLRVTHQGTFAFTGFVCSITSPDAATSPISTNGMPAPFARLYPF